MADQNPSSLEVFGKQVCKRWIPDADGPCETELKETGRSGQWIQLECPFCRATYVSPRFREDGSATRPEPAPGMKNFEKGMKPRKDTGEIDF